jgi:hypothetical protein
LTGYVRNFTDNVYKTGTSWLGFRPNATASTTPSAPRVFGVVLHATF